MGEWFFNPFVGNLDYYESGNGKFVLVAGDTMTGCLSVRPASGDNAIVVQAGKRLVLDG